MRTGVTFAELVDDLRAETGRSETQGHGIGDEFKLRRAINKAYLSLYRDYDWPHLRRVFTRVPMVAGQRFYDPPTGLDIERIETADAWWNGQPSPLGRSIGVQEYASYDSVADERSDPPLKYDIRYHDTPSNATMLEVWPVPASATASIEFRGSYQVRALVNDNDVCLLDAESVIMLAAADVAAPDMRDKAASDAALFVRQVRARVPDAAPTRMGLGGTDTIPAGRAVVRVR